MFPRVAAAPAARSPGICDNGSEDGEACNADADCLGGGQCKSDRRGHCQGGKENSKKCRHNKHCKGGASCSAEDPGTPGIIDPCDPYCNVTSDTASGLVVPGFVVVNGGLVPTGGITCGDSVVSPPENCDDGNTTAGDGCSAACKIEPGFQCVVPGMPCTASTCGNGIVEGIEQCDDGPWAMDSTGLVKDRPYDGCYNCERDFNCPSPAGATAQPCVAVCGDGIKFPAEACDDGNTTNGDGCSSTCTIEMGATCMAITAPSPPTLDVPVIYRDFNGGLVAGRHPDFQSPARMRPTSLAACVGGAALCVGGQRRGIPTVTLAADKEPVFNTTQELRRETPRPSASGATTIPVNKVILGKSIRLAERRRQLRLRQRRRPGLRPRQHQLRQRLDVRGSRRLLPDQRARLRKLLGGKELPLHERGSLPVHLRRRRGPLVQR